MVPSFEMAPLSNGSETDATPGWPPMSVNADSMAALGPGSVSLVPSLEAKTSWAVDPDWAGKRSSSRSKAFCDSLPGMANVSSVLPSKVKFRTVAPDRATSQRAMTTHFLRTATCPSRYSRSAMT